MDENKNQSVPAQPQPIIPPVSEHPSEPKPKLSKWIIVCIAIVLILGVSGAYLLGQSNATKTPTQKTVAIVSPTPTPTPDETANWKTYTDTQLGYSIKYPSELVEFKSDRFFLIGDLGRKDTADGFGPELQILSRGNNSALKAAEEELSTKDLKQITINGYDGIIGPFMSNPDPSFNLDFDYYLSPKTNNKTIRIIFSAQKYSKTVSAESVNKMRNIAIQMLSTFKFADTNSTNSATESCPDNNGMSYSDALKIAQKSECSQKGTLLETHQCNASGNGFWWIDFTPTTSQNGCNPACVVDIAAKTASINWRCTGVIPSQ